MIIILEGPDGSGKSTLAYKLAKQTKYLLMHRSKPESKKDNKNMMNEYLLAIKSGKNMIFDRCWYSEMVYGEVMRDASVISYPEMYELEKLLCRAGAIIIYCTDKPETLWTRCTKRGEDYVTDFVTHKEICDKYDEVLKVGSWMNMTQLTNVLFVVHSSMYVYAIYVVSRLSTGLVIHIEMCVSTAIRP